MCLKCNGILNDKELTEYEYALLRVIMGLEDQSRPNYNHIEMMKVYGDCITLAIAGASRLCRGLGSDDSRCALGCECAFRGEAWCVLDTLRDMMDKIDAEQNPP